jgi:TolB-like protein
MDLKFGDYCLKRHERLLVGPGGVMELSARSFDILQVLLDHPDQLMDKGRLFDAVWPGVAVEENTLQVHVSALRKLLGPSLIATVHGRGYKYAGPAPVPFTTRTGAERPAPRKPVIAVLPLDNLSGDPGQQYFSDGITQDIIDRLTRFRAFSVIGHHSSLGLADRKASFAEIRGVLNAGYFVTGNIRKSANRIRIAVRLADATTEAAIWAEHYDRPIEDLFEIQDEVADIIASTLSRHLEIELMARSNLRHPGSLTSYEHILQGYWHFRKLTRAANDLALGCFERAIALDPHSSEAMSWLAFCYVSRWIYDFSGADLKRGLDLAVSAVENDPANPSGHIVHGFGHLWMGGLAVAAPSLERSFLLNPGDPNILSNLGLLAVYQGQPSEAARWLAQANKLNPIPMLWYAEFGAIQAFLEGRYAEAIPPLEAIPDGGWDMMYALSCYGHLGLRQKALDCRQRFASEGRHLDFVAAAQAEPYRNAEVRERLVSGIVKALSF